MMKTALSWLSGEVPNPAQRAWLRPCLRWAAEVLLVAAVVAMVSTFVPQPSVPSTASSAPQSRVSLHLAGQESPLLDALRGQATLGDTRASLALVSTLLSRLEPSDASAGNHDLEDARNLFEAIIWIDRDWDSPEYRATHLIEHLVARHCGHPVLRWHWLCNAGE